jgi:hypothetical protein
VRRWQQTEAWGGGGGQRRAVPEGQTTGDEEGDVGDVGSGGEADSPPGVEEKPAVG